MVGEPDTPAVEPPPGRVGTLSSAVILGTGGSVFLGPPAAAAIETIVLILKHRDSTDSYLCCSKST